MQQTQALQLMGEQMKKLQSEYAKMKGIVDGKVLDKQIKEIEAAGKAEELKVEMEELAVKREELEVERMRIMQEAECAGIEGMMKIDERDSKERELQLKVAGERESREFERESMARKGEQEREKGAMQLHAQAQKAEAEAAKYERQATEPATEPAVSLDQIKTAIEGAVKSLLPAIEKMIQDSQTVRVVPQTDSSGKIVGGKAFTRGGDSRDVSLH